MTYTMKFHKTFYFVIIASFLFGALWWGHEGLRVQADSKTFLRPTGQMINLTHGQVHYRWHGANTGKLAVLVHGITSNEGVMGWLARDMVKDGFQVLTFDLYGRGYSDNARDVPHTHELFTGQINELLSKLGRHDDKFTLVGYSMGGAVSTIYTAQFGHRVEKLVLISPAGMPLEFPLAAKIGNLPYIGEFMTSNNFFKYFFTATAMESFVAPHIESEYSEYIVALSHFHVCKVSFFDALLSTLRNFPLNNAMEFYDRVGKSRIPVLLVWGTVDQMCPYSGALQATKLVPQAELITLENAGHAALLENATVLNTQVLDFLRRDSPCDISATAPIKNVTYASRPSASNLYLFVNSASHGRY